MIKVLNLKDVLKYLVKLTFILIIIVGIARYFSNIKERQSVKLNINLNTQSIREKLLKMSLEDTIPKLKTSTKINNIDENYIEKILGMELSVTKNIKAKKIESNNNTNNIENNQTIEEAKVGLETEVQESSVKTKYTNTYGSVLIKNESNKELTEEVLKPNIVLNNLKDILIFHTHTCESYTQSENYKYEESGNYRTIDLNYSVSRVGDELQKHLNNYGYNVNHNKSYHDYPAYTGSYGRSLITVQNELNMKSGTEMIFDLHRDAIGSDSNYAPTVKIGEEYVAQIMFVIGTDGGGLNHPNWQQNLKFAIKIQEKANELYPGLMKPIILRNSRYNQHLSNAATIIEVGATGNTLDQCLNSMKYFSKVLSEVIK